MALKEVKHYKSKSLPTHPVPDAILYIKGDGDTEVSTYITDINGIPYPLKDDQGSTGIQTITNTDGTISVLGGENKVLNLSSTIKNIINSALQSGDNISELINDAGYLTSVDLLPYELLSNKQNSLLHDGTGDKYPTVDAINAEVEIINDVLDQKLNIVDYNEYFQGKYSSLSALQTAKPTGKDGDYAIVDIGAGEDAKTYLWDSEDGWVEGGSSGAATTDALPEGSTNLYFQAARVLATVLNGISFAVGTPVTSADNILVGFGKIQKQISDLITAVANIFQPNQLISSVAPTRAGNTFTFPAEGYEALINKTQRTNPSSFITTIATATPDYKRIDLIWFKEDNTLQKVVGTESLTVAVRPDIPVGQVGVPVSFINVFGDVVEDPTPIINAISIQNSQGDEQFTVSENGYMRFRNVTFNSASKEISIDALTPFTAFVDSVNGSDIMGQLENKDKPFKTDLGAYNALPADDGSEWTLLYIDSGVTRSMSRIPNRNLIIKCLGSGTFNWNISSATIFQGSTKSLTIDVKKANITYTNTAASIFCDNTNTISISCNAFTTNADVTGGISGWFRGNLTLSASTFTTTADINMFGCDGIVNISHFRTSAPVGGSLVDNGVNSLLTLNIDRITKLNNVTLVLVSGNSGPIIRLNISSISGSGLVRFKASGGKTMDINMTNFTYDSTISVDIMGDNAGGLTTVRGTSSFSKVLTVASGGGIKNIVFDNFIGRVSSLPNSNANTYTFNNSTIEIASTFISGTGINSTSFNGSNSILSDSPNSLFSGITTPSTFSIKGTLKTNFLSYGANVTSVDRGLTFKEKQNEVIVRSKIDIINKVLSSSIKYIIDSNLILLTGEYIEVPYGGLDLGGYGFDTSSISKNVSGQSIFISPVGNSGNFVSKDISYYPGVGSVFNITDATGGHAIELNDVNLQGVSGSSIGILNGYRQFTGTTLGFYNLSDGLTLEGNWSGFKLTNTNIIGFASTGTLFKKGTATLFSNRFYIDLNLQIATGSKICDFTPSNFTNDKSLQVVNCYTKVNGIIDDATTVVTFPNITPYDAKSYFVNNIGIKNSNNMPYGISTANMLSYADDSAAAAGGIVQVGETYIESSTGYFKVRNT